MKDLRSSPIHTQKPASCFKTCDMRGWAPEEFSTELVFRTDSAIVAELKAGTLVDRDIGLEHSVLAVAFTRDFGCNDSGLSFLAVHNCADAVSRCKAASIPRRTALSASTTSMDAPSLNAMDIVGMPFCGFIDLE